MTEIFPRRSWSWVIIEQILLPILQEKVITEADLLDRIVRQGGRVAALDHAYQRLVANGFPIRRKVLMQRPTHGHGRANRKNRVVVYYLE